MNKLGLSACGAAFKCQNGLCIDWKKTCDAKDDCGDRSDEILPCGNKTY